VAAASVATLSGVSKTFDHTEAVAELSLDVAQGQIFGLIGPSGCGKTTTIRLLLGVLVPDGGEVRVMGSDPCHFSTRQREQIGYSPQGFFLYPTLTVKENLRFVAGLFGVGWRRRRRRIPEVLKLLELDDARNRLTRNLSGGMQRRLGLACALVHDPTLLFVDEPTAGLDPVLRATIWAFLRQLRSQGTTVFVTTQLIEEIQHCDNVAIMNRGKLAALGSPNALRREAMQGEVVEVVVENVSREGLTSVRGLAGVNAVRWTDDGDLRVMVDDASHATPAITQALSAAGADVTAVREYVPSFDEVFTRIVERSV
jgi:ABC-2 type transport system ATP-binding protein